jgi:plasmid stabilization system protein ParE
MAAELNLAPEVEWDVLEAYAWYEGRRLGLGEEFLTCVDACIQVICRHPEMYAKVYADYRRALVRRFPYAVFYEYSENEVTVYCVFHTSRDPQKWREVLESRSQLLG